MARVVTSDEAVRLIGVLQHDIHEVEQRLTTMLATGEQLASPQVWEGTAANRFRDEEWSSTRQWASSSIARLEELRASIHRINENIMAAGGGLG